MQTFHQKPALHFCKRHDKVLLLELYLYIITRLPISRVLYSEKPKR